MNRLQRKIVIDAMDYAWALSEKDNEFIESLAEKDEDYELSEAQNKWLNDIGTKVARI